MLNENEILHNDS